MNKYFCILSETEFSIGKLFTPIQDKVTDSGLISRGDPDDLGLYNDSHFH